MDGHEQLVTVTLCAVLTVLLSLGTRRDEPVPAGAGVFEEEVLAVDIVDTAGHQSPVDADAVVLVNHHIAGLEIGEDLLGGRGSPPRLAPGLRHVPAKELLVGEQVPHAVRAPPLPPAVHHALHKGE